jgi:hypothetical protein
MNKAQQILQQIKDRLDIDKDGDIDADDVLAAVEGNQAKLIALSAGGGLLIGVVLGALLF